jgi:hypothetical protein
MSEPYRPQRPVMWIALLLFAFFTYAFAPLEERMGTASEPSKLEIYYLNPSEM